MSMTLLQAEKQKMLDNFAVYKYKLVDVYGYIRYCIVMSACPNPAAAFRSTIKKGKKVNSNSDFDKFVQNVEYKDVYIVSINYFSSQAEAANFKNLEMDKIYNENKESLISKLKRKPII